MELATDPSLAEVEAVATRVQARLTAWLDAVPNPPLEQIAVAAQATWRLAAVRKTLHLIRNPALQAKKKKSGGQRLPPEFNASLLELERLTRALLLPKPAPAANATAPSGPVPPNLHNPREMNRSLASLMPRMPGMPGMPRMPRMPRLSDLMRLPSLAPRAPRPPSPPAPPDPTNHTSSSLNPSPSPPACPTLRAPLHTARAAERQANALCRAAGLPIPPPPPARAGQRSPRAPQSPPPAPPASATRVASHPRASRAASAPPASRPKSNPTAPAPDPPRAAQPHPILPRHPPPP